MPKRQLAAVPQVEEQAAPAAGLTGKDLAGEVERIDEADMAYLERVIQRQQFAAQIRERAEQADIEVECVTRLFREVAAAKYKLGIMDEIMGDGRIIRKQT